MFIDTIFRLHGLLREIVSDRDPRFTAAFWRSVCQTLGTRLTMSTDAVVEGKPCPIPSVLAAGLHEYARVTREIRYDIDHERGKRRC